MFRIGPINPPPLNVVALPTGNSGQCWPQQSPIVLSKAASFQADFDANFPKGYFKIEYPAAGRYPGYFELKDGHRNFVLCEDSGPLPAIRLGHETAHLIKVHYHDGSEHDVEGVQKPGEIHLIHKIVNPQEGSTLIVLGVHFEPDPEAKSCLTVCAPSETTAAPTPGCESPTHRINPTMLLPVPDAKGGRSKSDTSKHWYRYEGSLTTPPFSETVRWLVFAKPIRACNEDLKTIRCGATQHEEPTQPLNRRFVLRNFA